MKKIIRLILMAAMIVGLLSGMCLVAEAEYTDVYYKDANGATVRCANYTLVESSNSNGSWYGDDWYVVTKDTSISGYITVSGNVNLILCDGATLSMSAGNFHSCIALAEGSSLSIYEGNTTNSIIGSGALTEVGNNSAIRAHPGATVNIYGGRITAVTYTGAAIYGSGGSFNVYGGLVKAVGSSTSSGIYYNGTDASINIMGGTVLANGGNNRGLECSKIAVGSGLLKYESGDGSSWNAIDTLGTNTAKYAAIGEGVVQVNNGSKYPTLDIALQNCNTSGRNIITLLQDIYTFNTTKIPEGKSIMLDLNDHGIMYGEGGSASVITIENGGVLTLKDDSANKTDRYITLKDGRGTGIKSNESAGTIVVTGGFITGGTGLSKDSSTYGGGVNNEGTFFMLGGTIAGNKADCGGGVYTTGDFQINDTPEIRDNASSNVYLPEDGTITVAGPLTNEKPIGITMQTPGQFTAKGDFIGDLSDYKDRFASDDSDYIVSVLEDPDGNQLQLIKYIPPQPPEPTPTPTKVSGTLLSKMTAKGNRGLVLKWNKVNGAEGYDVFFSQCNHNGKETTCKKVKTIKGNKTFKWTRSGLKKGTAYKAYVRAWVMKDGNKSYVKTSPTVHAYTSGGNKNYTNAKSVTVNKTSVSLNAGKTYKINAGVTKLKKGKKMMPTWHAPTLRYISSNNNVATVSKGGKVTAKGNGNCKVYVIAVNGARKAVSVTVK